MSNSYTTEKKPLQDSPWLIFLDALFAVSEMCLILQNVNLKIDKRGVARYLRNKRGKKKVKVAGKYKRPGKTGSMLTILLKYVNGEGSC